MEQKEELPFTCVKKSARWYPGSTDLNQLFN